MYQKYIKLYQATGGVISLEKSTLYHWIWIFKNGMLKLFNIQETNDQIPLTQVLAHKATRTLGMKLEPELIFQEATDFIQEKMYNFHGKMSGAPLDGYKANIAYRCFYTSSVYYGVEYISLNKK